MIKDIRGKPKAFIATTKDITERKKIEDDLRKSEVEFKFAFDNATDAIFWADAETGRLVYCNRAAEAFPERKRNQVIGFHQSMLHP